MTSFANDMPIVFTIMKNENDYSIFTKDKRALNAFSAESSRICYKASAGDVFNKMSFLSEKLNNKGYAVLFETV